MATLATVENDGKVNVKWPAIGAIVAILGVVPAVVTAVTSAIVNPRQQQSTAALEQRKFSIDLYRTALANPDATQRHLSVQFLIAAGLVDDPENKLTVLPAEKVPHWPVASGPLP